MPRVEAERKRTKKCKKRSPVIHKIQWQHGLAVFFDTGHVSLKPPSIQKFKHKMDKLCSLTRVVLFLEYSPIFLENNTGKQCFLTLLVFSPTTIMNSWSFGRFMTFWASKLFHFEYLMDLNVLYTNLGP